MTVLIRALALCATFIATSPALAQGTGAKGYFNIYNVTVGHEIVGFYTNEGHGWTTNWLTAETLTVGEGAVAQFQPGAVTCQQTFTVGWRSTAGREIRGHPVAINICDATNVYLGIDKLSFD